MSSLLQYILTFIIVGIAVVYAGYMIYRRFSKKRRTSPCDDCEGCALKESFKEKNCPKDLFHPK